MEDIEYYDIPIYNFPYDVEEDDEETIQDNSELRVSDSVAVYHLHSDEPSSLCSLLPSSDLKKKSRLMARQSALASTHGESSKLITLSTQTLADSVPRSLGEYLSRSSRRRGLMFQQFPPG
jgi:hypothetical protein